MPRYLVIGSYTHEGLKGLLKEGGSKRKEAVGQLAKSVGGRLEAMYFAFGKEDFYVVADFPDNVTAAAVTMLVNSTGATSVRTVVLLTPEEIDQATKKTVTYRSPGQ